jgi:hypothetical protein
VAAVLNLDAGERERVLREADRARWSVRQLRENVVQMRRAEGERRGRPATNDQLRLLRLLNTSVRLLSDAVAELQSGSGAAPEVRADMARLARESVRLTNELEALIGTTHDSPVGQLDSSVGQYDSSVGEAREA